MSEFPSDAFYTEQHEWTRTQDGVARIGITQYAADQLGDITMVELPEEGDEVKQEDEFGTIESVKAVSALYAPVSGKVVKINGELEDHPELVNDDPYEAGWLLEVDMSDPAEIDGLMSAEAYAKFVAEAEE